MGYTSLRLYVSTSLLASCRVPVLVLVLVVVIVHHHGPAPDTRDCLGCRVPPSPYPYIPSPCVRACTACRWHCSAASSSGPHAVRTLLLFCLFSVFFFVGRLRWRLGAWENGFRSTPHARTAHGPRPRALPRSLQLLSAVSCLCLSASVRGQRLPFSAAA